jgi:hypothetical protein
VLVKLGHFEEIPAKISGGTMRKASRVFAYLCVPCLLLIAALGVRAGRPGQFTGDFRITQATPLPENMTKVRFSMHVINMTGVDVTHASITLSSTLHRTGPAEAWETNETPITIEILRYNEHKTYKPIEATFTVPTAEYERWSQKGSGGPSFIISFVDASGVQQHDRVELSPAP